MRKKKYSKNVGVLLTDDTYEKLVQVTNSEEITMSEFVRKLIEDEINQKGETNNE